MKKGRSGALKLGKLVLSCKANKLSDAGAGDLGVLPAHEASTIEMAILPIGDVGLTRFG